MVNIKMPAFQRYSPEARYCSAVSRFGFSVNTCTGEIFHDLLASDLMYPYQVSGFIGKIPKTTILPC
jgi:hypothetical protein